MTTQTQKAGDALIACGNTVKNRGHAWIILRDAGLNGSGAVFNGAVKAYEAHFNVTLGKSQAKVKEENRAAARATAYQMSAQEVIDLVESLDEANDLFWACWDVFKNEGKWSSQLTTDTFRPLFMKKGAPSGS